MLPHPEGARQIITITMPEGMWVFLPSLTCQPMGKPHS
jgi:hypothetical protein